MTAKFTSRVWACWDAAYDALAAAAWTVHPKTGLVPPVVFSGARHPVQEMISLPGMKNPRNDETQEWATMGGDGVDEEFTLVIKITSEVPGFTVATDADPARAVRNRVRDLSALVESTFRNQLTGRCQGIAVTNVWKWEITAVIPAIAALDGGGFGCDCALYLTFTARI